MATPLRTVDANELAATTMESFVPSARKPSAIKGRKSSVDARPTPVMSAGKPPRRVSFKTTDASGDEFKRSQKMGGTFTTRVYARERERESEWRRGKTEEKDVCDKMRAIRVEYE